MRNDNFTAEQIAVYRQRLVLDPAAEISGTEARAILGVSWNLLGNWLDEEKRAVSQLPRWRQNPFDGRGKLIPLADVIALLDQQAHIQTSVPATEV